MSHIVQYCQLFSNLLDIVKWCLLFIVRCFSLLSYYISKYLKQAIKRLMWVSVYVYCCYSTRMMILQISYFYSFLSSGHLEMLHLSRPKIRSYRYRKFWKWFTDTCSVIGSENGFFSNLLLPYCSWLLQQFLCGRCNIWSVFL